MGADNLARIYGSEWATAGIASQPFRLLLYLAYAADDRPQARSGARVFRGERWTLARALGDELPDASAAIDDDSARRARVNALRQVRRALNELQDAGVVAGIRPVAEGFRGDLDVLEIEFRLSREVSR